MGRSIAYIDQHGRKCGMDVFLNSFSERGIDTTSTLRLLERFDYAGGISMPEEIYLSELDSLPSEPRSFLEDSTNINRRMAYLRGDFYYLYVTFDNDKEQVRGALVELIPDLQNAIAETEFSSHLDENEKLLHLSLLDHKKYYSLVVLAALYNHMLIDSEFDVAIYDEFKDICEQDIRNYYHFLLGAITIQKILQRMVYYPKTNLLEMMLLVLVKLL